MNVKIKIFFILFLYAVFTVMCVFHIYSTSQFTLATFRVLSSHIVASVFGSKGLHYNPVYLNVFCCLKTQTIIFLAPSLPPHIIWITPLGI